MMITMMTTMLLSVLKGMVGKYPPRGTGHILFALLFLAFCSSFYDDHDDDDASFGVEGRGGWGVPARRGLFVLLCFFLAFQYSFAMGYQHEGLLGYGIGGSWVATVRTTCI